MLLRAKLASLDRVTANSNHNLQSGNHIIGRQEKLYLQLVQVLWLTVPT